MKKHDVLQLRNGIYRLHWRDGGFSIAAIGSGSTGSRWMAPLNFTEPLDERDSVRKWMQVERAELLLSMRGIGLGAPDARYDVAHVHELFPYSPLTNFTSTTAAEVSS